ncbi:hypothetical protein [Baekduia alba]|uniref:hypothetical protein n=1 Tax=Baekduia alba TaxID=2997333 RepID=UPI002341EE18|nr:hypothetical protein [Baekduia alba]
MEFVVSTCLAIVGLYLAHSLLRHQQVRVADRRIASYAALWELMEVTRPDRLLSEDADRPMTIQEAKKLYAALSRWYFTEGGMLFTAPTLAMFLVAKRRLASSLDASKEGHPGGRAPPGKSPYDPGCGGLLCSTPVPDGHPRI